MAVFSNEAMYHKIWATFVDSAISRHQLKTSDGRAGEDGGDRVGNRPIELQDVLRVEEILAKLERAEGGWIDYDNRPVGLDDDIGMEARAGSYTPVKSSLLRAYERKPLETPPGLPPMFQNPGPSFLTSMYNAVPVQSGAKDGAPPLDVQVPRPGNKAAPGGAGAQSFTELKGLPGGDDCIVLVSGEDNSGGVVDGSDKNRLCSRSSAAGRAAAVSIDENRWISESPRAEPEIENMIAQSMSQKSLPELMESLNLAGSKTMLPPPPLGGDPLKKPKRDGVCHAAGGGQESERNSSTMSSNDVYTSPAACEEQLVVVAAEKETRDCSRGDDEEAMERSLYLAEGAQRVNASSSGTLPQSNLFPESAMLSQPSACVNTTCIEGADPTEGGNKEEERPLLSAVSEGTITMMREVAVMNTTCPRGDDKSERSFFGDKDGQSPCALSEQISGIKVGLAALEGSRCGDGDSFDSELDLSGVIVADTTIIPGEDDDKISRIIDDDQCQVVPLASDSSATGHGAVTEFIFPETEDIRRSQLQLEFERKVSAAGNGSSREELPSATRPGADTMKAGSSVSCESFNSSSSSHREPSSQEVRRVERQREAGDHSRVDNNAESPELVRLGSASEDSDLVGHQEDPSFDRGSWRREGGVRCDNNSDEGRFSLEQSLDGAPTAGGRGGQAFGSILSPDIGGFGLGDNNGGVGAISPLTLTGQLDASDVDDDAYGGESGGGCAGWDLPVSGDEGDCGLSPVRSARSEITDDGPSPPQRTRKTHSACLRLEEDEEDGDDNAEDHDTTLTPEVPRLCRLSSSNSGFVANAGASTREGGGRDLGRENSETGASMQGADCHFGSSMPPPPPPPRQPSLTTQLLEKHDRRALSRISLTPKQHCRLSPRANTRAARTALSDRTNTPRGRYDDYSREQSLPGHVRASNRGAGSCDGGGGRADYNEQASIGSFSESEMGGSRSQDSARDEGEEKGDKERADGSSLDEGTPRRRGVCSRDDLGGFYPPLQVANVARKARNNFSLSTLQRSTLQWMLWRELGGEGEGRSRSSAVAATASLSDDDDATNFNVKGGVLGHLPREEASACVHALVQRSVASDDDGRSRADRARQVHVGTGLPRGRTLILAPTKGDAWRWSNRLESGSKDLSVLSYVMPMRERRRLSAKQAAAFDVVVTTYDVLKSKEVPRAVHAKKDTSPRTWALPGSREWRARNTKEGGQKRPATSKTDHMVSLLHGVWWDRVVADEAQTLATQRSARAVAALSLVGTARWCVIERDSMAVVENTSERMRCLTTFLRIPAEVPMVKVAESLFYERRPRDIAPLYPRAPGAADNSLSLTEGEDSQGNPVSCERRRRPLSTRACSKSSRRGGGGGARGGRRKSLGRERSSTEDGVGILASRSPAATERGSGERSPEKDEEESRRNGQGDKGQRIHGGAAVRGHVSYAATALRLRRARGGDGPTQAGHIR